MYDEIAQILIKNVRYYLDQNWQSKGYGGTPTKRGSGPKRSSSRLYNNIDPKIDYDEYGFPISFNLIMEEYWEYVDEGRKPGGIGPKGSTKLKDSIRSWILTKPVTWNAVDGVVPSLDTQVYLITRSIIKKGTAGTNFTELAIQKTLRESLDTFEDKYAKDIQEFLLDFTQFLNEEEYNLGL